MPPRNFTTQSILVLESFGHLAQNVETFEAHSGRKHDLLGFADILSFDPLENITYFIQITDHGNRNARFKKIINSAEACSLVWCNKYRKIWLMTWGNLDYKIEDITRSAFPEDMQRLVKQIRTKKKELAKIIVADKKYVDSRIYQYE